MPEPTRYFADPVERELAEETWKVAANPDRDPAYTWYPPHEQMKLVATSDFERRVITARNWITAMRDQELYYGNGKKGIDNVKGYYQYVHKRDIAINNTQIANVEHFYTNAMITLFGGDFYILLNGGTLVYEVVLQPLAVMVGNLSLAKGWNNLKNNWKQLVGPDKDGATFALQGKRYAQIDIQQFFNTDPELRPPSPTRPPVQKPEPPPAAGPKTVPVRPGHSLSAISKELYGTFEYWPLLWDLNPKAVRNGNPNRIIVGSTLQYKPLSAYTPAQLADAKKRFPTWKNYPL
ncbi:MAG: hypothetical protein KIT83_06820 [Bryobacterales bacterium]|nr:hypothetical protein [Bryobacterales bacterium]